MLLSPSYILNKSETDKIAVVNLQRTTVEPLLNDHPHQQPSLLYDHISCDGHRFLFVRSLTDDRPSNATNDWVRWNFIPRGRPL